MIRKKDTEGKKGKTVTKKYKWKERRKKVTEKKCIEARKKYRATKKEKTTGKDM